MTLKIEIMDEGAAAKLPKGKIKGKIRWPHDGTVTDAWFQKAEDEAHVQAYLDKEWADLTAAHEDEHNALIAAKDAELAGLQREKERLLDELEKQEEAIRAGARELGDAIEGAKRAAPQLDTSGMTVKQIRAAVIRSLDSATVLDGKSDDYIAARFDFIVDAAVPAVPADRDPYAVFVSNGITRQADSLQGLRSASQQAHAEYVQRLIDGHKKP